MLACSAGFSTNLFGIFYAFGAAIVFVSQNIFSKKLFNEAARAELEGQAAGVLRLDKLNLLCYCSALAFILTMPIWFFSEGYPLIVDFLSDGSIELSEKKDTLDHGPLMAEFIFNGVSHFAQNILAFILLSIISPVSYSVASLLKRVFVVAVAIVWFGNPTTSIQAFGIGLTFFGLYLYDRNSHEDAANRRANADHFHGRDSLLPMNTTSASTSASKKPWDSNGYMFPVSGPVDRPNGIATSSTESSKKEDGEPSRPRRSSAARTWLPPGTKQESTWQPGDSVPST
jgi:solute carrier family 35 protein E1